MKTKVLLIIFIFALLVLIWLRDSSSIVDAIYYGKNGNVCVYAYSDFNQQDVVDCGHMKIISSTTDFLEDLKSKDYLGQAIEVKNLDVLEFIKKNNLDIKKVEYVDGLKIYNCYLTSLPKFVVVDNFKVNIQIAESDEVVKVGYPLIIGGF